MATYNFTVRATDNLGAYADRAFSITVNNTNIDRFVVVGSTGLCHGADGVTWTVEAGQSGFGATFGNGKWVVYGLYAATGAAATALNIRTSPDAYNWTTVATGIPATSTVTILGSTYTATNYDITLLRFMNGAWSAFVTTQCYTVGSTYYGTLVEYTSTDLINWTQARQAAQFSNTSNSGITYSPFGAEYIYDVNSDTYLVSYGQQAGGNSGVAQRTSGTAWTARQLASSAVGQTSGSLSYTNGLWCWVPPNVTSSFGSAFTSVDGIGWTVRSMTQSQQCSGLVYLNGRLVSRQYANTTGATNYFVSSTNGGRTWSQNGAAAASYLANYANAAHQPCASYGGKAVVLAGDTSTSYQTITGSELSISNYTLPAIGTPYGVASRTS